MAQLNLLLRDEDLNSDIIFGRFSQHPDRRKKVGSRRLVESSHLILLAVSCGADSVLYESLEMGGKLKQKYFTA